MPTAPVPHRPALGDIKALWKRTGFITSTITGGTNAQYWESLSILQVTNEMWSMAEPMF